MIRKKEDGKLVFYIGDKEKKYLYYFFVVISFIIVILATRKQFYDPDGFWHIKTGEWILKNKQIPTTDMFSWYGIKNNLTWINHEWIFEILIYSIYKVFGLYGVMWSVAVIGGMIYLLIYKFTYIRSKNKLYSLFISMFSSLMIIPYISPRPQIISFTLLLTTCIFLEYKKWYYVLPVVVLEANFHGGFWPVFIIVISYYAYKEKPLLILLSILSIGINPNLFELFSYTFKNQSYSEGVKYIIESQRTIFASEGNMNTLIVYFLLLLLLHNARIKWQDGLMALAFTGLTFLGERHVVFAYLIILPILGQYAQSSLAHSLHFIGSKLKAKFSTSIVYFLSCIIVFSVLTATAKYNIRNLKSDNVLINNFYPSNEVINYIKNNNLQNVMNFFNDGGYLIFNDVQTLIDGRGDPFSPQFNDTNIFKDYMEALHLNADYKEFMNKYNIENVLIPQKSSLNHALKHDNSFTTLYKDEYYIIYKYNN